MALIKQSFLTSEDHELAKETAIKFSQGATLTRLEIEKVNKELLKEYLRDIKNCSAAVLRQLKNE